jgi:hypothetical protein
MKTLSTKSHSNKSPPNGVPSSLRIAGFGACMITGYPHESAGLFEVACGMVEKRLSRPVQSTIVSLGGFPAPRAQKYLKKNLFDFNPQYIVIQFGSTDAQCPIRAGSRRKDHCSSLSANSNSSPGAAQSATSYHSKPATALSALRWELASVIGNLRKIETTTPLSSYIAAIELMVDDCRSAGIKPVVLSPFVYGSRYTMKKAIPYVNGGRNPGHCGGVKPGQFGRWRGRSRSALFDSAVASERPVGFGRVVEAQTIPGLTAGAST